MSHTNCTTARVGSIAKLDVLATRHELGYPLWHPDDTHEISDESERLSKPRMQRSAGSMKPSRSTRRRLAQEALDTFVKAVAAEWSIVMDYQQIMRPLSNPGTFGAWMWHERKRIGCSRQELAAVMGRTDSTGRKIDMSGDNSQPATQARVRAALQRFEAREHATVMAD